MPGRVFRSTNAGASFARSDSGLPEFGVETGQKVIAVDFTVSSAKEFAGDAPTCAILKHTNPCGVGQGAGLREAATPTSAVPHRNASSTSSTERKK